MFVFQVRYIARFSLYLVVESAKKPRYTFMRKQIPQKMWNSQL